MSTPLLQPPSAASLFLPVVSCRIASSSSSSSSPSSSEMALYDPQKPFPLAYIRDPPLGFVEERFVEVCVRYSIGAEYDPQKPFPLAYIRDPPLGFVGIYTRFFEYSNFRLPPSIFLLDLLQYYAVH
ncbi:hypothetical protein L1987_15357 [Smallanthus sonchifolius]|uniref:Uncharacterized protein n=1 Tax=Smallanthus sonchifolius TaxID=185202 RepID=A0ACB9J5E0_9ASTR|nr:hypothetical protein L1987_15357 [Smallanthus sonchifolius]